MGGEASMMTKGGAFLPEAVYTLQTGVPGQSDPCGRCTPVSPRDDLLGPSVLQLSRMYSCR